ncbi:hypothetical protein [Aureibacter tunicatorum]|uniref:Uncharacterized protein n=1 Tax=Aureibacter tunicatorum TaxID=866807 RepID=A0AAE4BTR6_9BACT|nr:hypothetical protein [Aureibacter tunicatorum]MDR6240073.1 hypothetical protein [Aureibacter tunicatorum]BDD04544.1 hypothetical protein AUTU_20270 [Aureibacter tunicatorum]
MHRKLDKNNLLPFLSITLFIGIATLYIIFDKYLVKEYNSSDLSELLYHYTFSKGNINIDDFKTYNELIDSIDSKFCEVRNSPKLFIHHKKRSFVIKPFYGANNPCPDLSVCYKNRNVILIQDDSIKKSDLSWHYSKIDSILPLDYYNDGEKSDFSTSSNHIIIHIQNSNQDIEIIKAQIIKVTEIYDQLESAQNMNICFLKSN